MVEATNDMNDKAKQAFQLLDEATIRERAKRLEGLAFRLAESIISQSVLDVMDSLIGAEDTI